MEPVTIRTRIARAPWAVRTIWARNAAEAVATMRSRWERQGWTPLGDSGAYSKVGVWSTEFCRVDAGTAEETAAFAA